MTIENHESRLTAYALNELSAEERAAIEAELALDEAARAELLALREITAQLERELTAPSGIKLGQARMDRISRALDGEPVPQTETARPKARKRVWAWVSLAAAVPALAASALLMMTTVRHKAESSVSYAPALDQLAVPLPAASAAPPTLELADPAFRPRSTPDGITMGESYDDLRDNPFVLVSRDSRSTFSIDVDTASYSLMRRFLQQGRRPPRGAVRIEELVNYFTYDYPEPRAGEPLSLVADVAAAPWAPEHRLLRVGIKGRHVAANVRPAANLVFLIDVSGSMNAPNKLPLVKRGLSLLARQLDSRDRVAIVVYAGASGLVLPPTPGDQRGEISNALERLAAGGGTNGGEGIELAYRAAADNFVPGGINRVILATDGDFNLGVTNRDDLVELIQRRARGGVFLSALGFGDGNYKDSTLEALADKGNGNYAYIDSDEEARKVLVEQVSGTLLTVAKDVKIQLELNPRAVRSFRLIGYENRALSHSDFDDDKKDAGELGADHTVTALYELVPVAGAGAPTERELLSIDLRYKLSNDDQSQLIGLPVRDRAAAMSPDFRFAAAVAELGMLLRSSPYAGASSYADVLDLAEGSIGHGPDRDARLEFLDLVKQAQRLSSER